jgi:hypothetical protein
MKTFAALNFAACLAALGFSPAAAEDAALNLPRNLELGGLVTLDQESHLDGADDPKLDLGQVTLGANVSVAKDILASVVLEAKEDLDKIFFEQAMAQVTLGTGAWTLLFGQQTMSHGLLTTRLISDPEILPYVELKQPALVASWGPGALKAASGLVLIDTGEEAAESRDFGWVPSLDWNRGTTQMRVSGLVSRFRSDADVALTLAFGIFHLDAEGFARVRAWDDADRTAGYLIGAEYSPFSWLSVAYRNDGVTDAGRNRFDVVRNALGLTFTLKSDLFAALEFSDGRGGDAPGPRLALQLGLKSSLNLPGFQRSTLTQD